jgi:3-carboxy-cis,cis-muconate cycloisomerase
MAESVTMALAGSLGRPRARELVGAAAARAQDQGRPLRDELLSDEAIAAELSEDQIDAALDPAGYLGSAELFIDRALGRYRGEGS